MIQNQFRQNQQQLGENQDLQLAIDRDNQFQDRDLRTKVIFALQNIGKVQTFKRDGKQIQAYIKKQDCQESIKDLVKYLRKDVPENPKVSLILSQFNIIESDLIKVLVLHPQDKKLSFWLLALMSYLTMKPSDGLLQVEKQKLNQALRQYKRTFTKNEGITYLVLHISDYVKTPVQKRQKAHIQLMEFIVTLVRNLLQIRTQQVGSDELHSHFLLAMFKQDMLGPLFYILQHQKGVQIKNSQQFIKSELMQRIQIQLLQIFYHVFTCFDPSVLNDTKSKLNLWQAVNKLSNTRQEPARHSRFMPNFSQTTRTGINKITHTLQKKQQTNPNQRKAPNRLAQLKKVKKIQRQYIQQNFLQMMVDIQDDGNKKSIKQLVSQYSKQFVEVQFQILSKYIFDSIYKQTAKVNKQNVIQYLLLCNWILQMTRSKYQKDLSMAKTPQQKGAVQFDFGQVLCIMQNGHFQLIYKLLFRQATRDKKKDFEINIFHAAIILFLNYLQVIEDISMSFNMSDRKNANALMANMFRHDIARIFKIGFHQICHEKILKALIITTYKFFKLLSQYSGGKVLTIQTNKLLKGKKKGGRKGQQQDEKQMQNFISEDSDSDQSGSYNQQKQKLKVKKNKQKQSKPQKSRKQAQQQFRFQERKFNQITQFAIIADYQTINKYLIFLKHQRFLSNSKQLNIAIFFYFQKIVQLLKGQWLFFQAETLLVFNQILNNQAFAKQYKKQKQVIRKICSGFLSLLKINKLAIVQSLFRCSSLQIKEQIFKNYQDFGGEIDNFHHADSDI